MRCDIILIFTRTQKIVQLFKQAVFETILICKESEIVKYLLRTMKKTFFRSKNRFKFRKITRKNMSYQQRN